MEVSVLTLGRRAMGGHTLLVLEVVEPGADSLESCWGMP